MERSASRRQPSGGFTLVELLVVIGIIALLISILLPALNKAREQGKQAACLSNLRQIGTAGLMFAADHGQRVPLAGELFNVTGTPAGLHDPRQKFYTYYNSGGTQYVTPLNVSLAPYLGQKQVDLSSPAAMTTDMDNGYTRRVFTCPSQVDNPQRTQMISNGDSNLPQQINSYGWNEEVVGWCDNGVGGLTGHSRARGQLTRIGHAPADTFWMCDANPRSGTPWVLFYSHPSLGTLADCYNPQPSGAYGDPSQFDLVRHRGKICVLFMDGHAEKFDIGKPTDRGLASIYLVPPGFGI